MSTLEPVAPVRLLDSLEPATRSALLDAGPVSIVPAGSFLVHDGDTSIGVFLVVDGLLKIVKNSYEGKVSFIGLRSSGTFAGELATLTGTTRSSSMQAVQPSRVIKIGQDGFERLLVEHPDLSRALLREMAEHLRVATMQIHDLMNADARTRIASRLVRLSDDGTVRSDGNPTLALPISQEELADWAGLSRAGAVKALRALREDGLIETARMSITINDLARLRENAIV